MGRVWAVLAPPASYLSTRNTRRGRDLRDLVLFFGGSVDAPSDVLASGATHR